MFFYPFIFYLIFNQDVAFFMDLLDPLAMKRILYVTHEIIVGFPITKEDAFIYT